MKKIKVFFKVLIELTLIIVSIFFLKSSTGKKELFSMNENINKSVDLSTMAIFINKEEEEKAKEEARQTYLWGVLDSFTGDLTGYYAYCPLCTGHLACMSSLDLSNGRTTYGDKTYGEVSIVASSKNLPCGSIVKFQTSKLSDDPILAIVLDRGVLGKDLDLLVPSTEYAINKVGRIPISYDVLRMGWEK